MDLKWFLIYHKIPSIDPPVSLSIFFKSAMWYKNPNFRSFEEKNCVDDVFKDLVKLLSVSFMNEKECII